MTRKVHERRAVRPAHGQKTNNTRKYLPADALFTLLREGFERILDYRPPDVDVSISLPDALMSAFAVFSLKDPSLLAFDQRRNDENTGSYSSTFVRPNVTVGWRYGNTRTKNQGYQFEHNFGHGKQNLSVVFALLMMLAFLVDQTQQLCCPLFRAVWNKLGSKRMLWERIRSFFLEYVVYSMR